MFSEVEILADTELREQAINAVEQFSKHHELKVRPNQINGLRQVAALEPDNVGGFAKHQRDRLGDSDKFFDEREFWNLISDQSRTLDERVEQFVERELAAQEFDSDKQRKKAKTPLMSVWRKRLYPPFFQHFCIHYLYCAIRQ